MPQDATCPKCSHTFPVTEARGAYTVACPRCEAELTAEFAKPAAPPEAGEPPYELKVKAGALPGAAAPPPAPRRKKSEDDEPKRGGGSALVVLVSGGLGLLFVLGGLGLTGWFLFTQVDVEPTGSRAVANRNTVAPNRPNVPNPRPNPNPWTDPNPPVKKKETFSLSPVGGSLSPIQPPAGVDTTFTTQIPLAGPAGAVAVGGGGRYLVIEVPTQSQLVVFDANAGRLLDATANTGGFGVQIAAGANKVVHTVPGTKRLRVLSLPDLQTQTEFESPLFHQIQALALGSRTNGPLLASDPFGEVVLMDLASGQPIEGSQHKLDVSPDNLKASTDGRQFLVGGGFGSNDPHKLIEEVSSKWRVRNTSVFAASFGADGRRLFGKNQIVMAATGATLATKPVGVAGDVWYVPALTSIGSYFVRVNEARGGAGRQSVSLSIHRNTGVDAAVVPAWEGLAEMSGLVGFGAQGPLDRHVFLIPEAKLLVILTRDKTKLVLRKVGI